MDGDLESPVPVDMHTGPAGYLLGLRCIGEEEEVVEEFGGGIVHTIYRHPIVRVWAVLHVVAQGESSRCVYRDTGDYLSLCTKGQRHGYRQTAYRTARKGLYGREG